MPTKSISYSNVYCIQMYCSHEYSEDLNLKYRLQLEINLVRNISFSEEPLGSTFFYSF